MAGTAAANARAVRATWTGVLASVLLTAVVARGQDLVFDHLSVEDGLSHGWVLALAKDDRGFLWVGTQNGLDRFDGQRIVSYRPQPGNEGSLVGSRIQALYEDAAGRLWVRTNGALTQATARLRFTTTD